MAITPLKDIQGRHIFGTNGKPVYDFLCENNNVIILPHILHRCWDIADY